MIILKLIVGLGNPGKEYDNTRHNIGFMIIDNYINSNAWKKLNGTAINSSISWQKKFNASYTIVNVEQEKVIFVKPETFMNLSGNSILEFVHFYKIAPKDILIIHDDLDLPIGKFRIKTNSSSGGHNGIKSIIECLGTNSFARLKVGISKTSNGDIKNYVLGHFNKEEHEILDKLYPTFNNIINDFLKKDITKIMNDYNGAK